MANIGTQAIAELVLRIKAENLAGAALSSVATNMRALPLVAAGAAAGVAVAAVKMAADYQNSLTSVANNTTLGTQGIKQMDAAIRQVSKATGAGPDTLAQAYMHVRDMGFGAADATQILMEGTKSATSTHGDAVATVNLLASVMHEYSMRGVEAAHAMDTLHQAGAESNMTLLQFVEGGGKAIAMAANLGVPLQQVSAAMAALTLHGETADVAATNLVGLMSHIVNPTKAAREELTALSAKTGIDLLADFTPQGLQTKGLRGIIADLHAAHIDAGQLFKIIPAIRGGLGAQILTGTGSADFARVLGDLEGTMSGRLTPTATAFARTQQTLDYQMNQLRQSTHWLGMDLGNTLLPAMTRLISAVVPIIQGLDDWVDSHQRLIATAGPLFIALSTIAGLALVAGPAIALLGVVFSPLSLAVMGLVAVIGVLSVAWATNWGGIQQKVAATWSSIQPALVQIAQAISAIGGAFKKGGLSAAANELMTQAGTLLGRLLAWTTGTAWPALSAAVGRWATAFWQWVGRVAPPIMAALGVLLGRLAGWATGTALPAIAAAAGRWAGALWGWVQQATPPLLSALGMLLGRLGSWLMGTALPAIATQLGRWAVAFWAWAGPATTNLISHLGPLLDRLGSWIGTTALPAISAKLVQWGTAFWHWIVVAMPVMEEKLGEFLGQMIVWIPTASAALTAKLFEWGTAFVGWLLPRWLDLLGKLTTFLGNIGNWIVTTAIPALLKLGWDMGTQLIAGMIKGISDAAGHVKEAIDNALHGKHTAVPGGPLDRPGTAGGWTGPSGGPSATAGPLATGDGRGGVLAADRTGAVAAAAAAAAAAASAASAAAGKDFSAALAAYSRQSGRDPADQKRMQADIALVARTSTQQAKHLHDLLDAATRHPHEVIRHQGAVEAAHRRPGAPGAGGGGSGGGTGSTSGGLSPATAAAIAAAAGNAPKKETPAQTAAADFRAALTYFRAEKGLDPALVARMQADIAVIARSDPGRARDLTATLTTVRGQREDAIRHAGAVAAHHAQVLAQRARVTTVHDDVNRFKTDLLTLGTSAKDHARLIADYLRIQRDETTAHDRNSQVAYDLAENIHKVQEHFKGLAAALRTPIAPVPRYGALAGETGYGQTTVSFGGAQQSPLQQIVAELRNQLTLARARYERDERVIALLEGVNQTGTLQLGALRDISGGILRPGPPAPQRSAHSVLRAAGSYAPVTR